MSSFPPTHLTVAYLDRALSTLSNISGTGWEAGNPVSNLQTTRLEEASTLSTSSANITLDLGSTLVSDMFCIVRHSLSPGSTWRVRTSNDVVLLTDPDSIPGNVIFDSGTIEVWPDTDDYSSIPYAEYTSWAQGVSYLYNPPAAIYAPSGSSARYVYIDIVGTSGEEVAKLFIGPYWLPSNGVSANWSISYQPLAKPTRLHGSTVITRDLPQYRQLTFSCKYLTETDTFEHSAIIDREFRVNKPYLACINPSNPNSYRTLVYGANTKVLVTKNSGFQGFYSKAFKIEEWL